MADNLINKEIMILTEHYSFISILHTEKYAVLLKNSIL